MLASIAYFPKALDRLEPGHAFESFWVAVPLLVLWIVELLAVGDRWLRTAFVSVRSPFPRSPVFAHLATVLFTITIVGCCSLCRAHKRPPSIGHPRIFYATAPVPASGMLGYAIPGTTPVAEVSSLGSILDRYAGRTAPVFDFADEPGVVYYLLNRVPVVTSFLEHRSDTGGTAAGDHRSAAEPTADRHPQRHQFRDPQLRRRPRCHPLVCHRRVPVHPLHAPRRLPRPAPPPAG